MELTGGLRKEIESLYFSGDVVGGCWQYLHYRGKGRFGGAGVEYTPANECDKNLRRRR